MSVQQTNLLPEKASRNDTIPQNCMYNRAQCLPQGTLRKIRICETVEPYLLFHWYSVWSYTHHECGSGYSALVVKVLYWYTAG